MRTGLGVNTRIAEKSTRFGHSAFLSVPVGKRIGQKDITFVWTFQVACYINDLEIWNFYFRPKKGWGNDESRRG